MRMQVDGRVAPIPMAERRRSTRATADVAAVDAGSEAHAREGAKWRRPSALRMLNIASMRSSERAGAAPRASLEQVETASSAPGRWPSDDLLQQAADIELG